MSATLKQANAQWERRPADERFASLTDMDRAARRFRESAIVQEIKVNALAVAASGDDIVLTGPKTGHCAYLNNWSFGQLAARASAPAAYLKTLPACIAADCLNTGLMRAGDTDKSAQVLLGQDDSTRLTCRAVTSEKYSRIWNSDITSRLLELEARGPWQPAPEAFDGSRGLYLGDRDCFAFLVDNERRIFETAPGGGLSRGFFVWNSEVGDSAFGIMSFLYEFCCGNHRVFGAQNIAQAKVIHIGADQSPKAFEMMACEVRKYAEASGTDDELKIERCQRFEIGSSKDDVLNAIFGLKIPALTKTIAREAYDLAEQHADWYGSPRSAWGFSGGLTEVARDMANASDRHQLDLAATRVMSMAD